MGKKQVKQKFTISRTGTFYQIWNNINIMACIYLTISYPYYTVNMFPSISEITTSYLLLIYFAEFICICDLIIHFFL